MRPIAEYEPMDRATFEREIVPMGEPAVFRGLVAGWPLVHAGRAGPGSLDARSGANRRTVSTGRRLPALTALDVPAS